MFGRFFKRQRPAPVVITPGTPGDTVVWAVGDIHGRLDLLDVLLKGLEADMDASSAQRKVIVFLGDYVDRGPDSCGVIDRLCDFQDRAEYETVFLKGNHEDKLVEFLDDPSVGAQWCEYGGAQALKSFGLTAPTMTHRMAAWTALSADLAHKLTDRRRRFLEDLITSFSLGGYFFVHAGARPGVALENQSPSDLMWIRISFLDSPERFPQVIVHGHTPTRDVHIDDRRIGVDTKAYASGVLSAIRLEDTDQRIIQAVQNGDEIVLRCRDAAEVRREVS